jgi:hypothetical protein
VFYLLINQQAHRRQMLNQLIRRSCLTVWLISFLSLPVLAEESLSTSSSSLHFSGFATFAGTYNNNDEAGASASFGQKHVAGQGLSTYLDSVIGGQIDWRIRPGTSVTFQGVASPSSDMEPILRMGYFRQQFDNNLALRLGRIRSPVYFDSDVVEIGYAYLMMRPALPIYTLLNTFSWIDGVDVQWRFPLNNMVFLAQGYGGQVDYDVGIPGTSRMTNGSLEGLIGIAMSLITPNIMYRASHSYANRSTMRSDELRQLNAGLTQLSTTLNTLAMNPLLPAEITRGLNQQALGIDALKNPYNGDDLTYTSIGFDAYLGHWRLMGEWVRVNPDSEILGVHQGFQVSVGYNIGQWTPYASFAHFRRQSALLDTQALSPTGLDPVLDAGLSQAKTELDNLARYSDDTSQSISLGMRWDFRKNMDLKVQYDHIRTPNQWTPGALSTASLPFDNTVNLVTVGIDVIF